MERMEFLYVLFCFSQERSPKAAIQPRLKIIPSPWPLGGLLGISNQSPQANLVAGQGSNLASPVDELVKNCTETILLCLGYPSGDWRCSLSWPPTAVMAKKDGPVHFKPL
jgi:hypothetical protein